MSLSAFPDKAAPPDVNGLRAVLGSAHPCWERTIQMARSAHGPLEPVWKHPGKAFGWSLRLVQGKRVLLYLTLQQGRFLASVVLGERAARAALADPSLPGGVREALAAAPVHMEGRGLRLELGPQDDPAPILRLLAHKVG